MIHSVNYANILQYSPRGASDNSKKSKNVVGAIKGGRIGGYTNRISELISEHQGDLANFLNKDITLIPIPRSSPIRESDLWPALEIAKMLASLNVGNVSTCLFRTKAIRKSSLYFTAEERPSIAEQYDSMGVKDFVPTENITLIDDILTSGRTSIAAASRVAEKFPNATIRMLALIRTMSFTEIDTIQKVEIGTKTYYPASGKCYRDP
jgi:hypothetical protein